MIRAVEVFKDCPGEEWEKRGGCCRYVYCTQGAVMGVHVCGGSRVEYRDSGVKEEGFEVRPSPIKDVGAPSRAPCIDISNQE